MSDPVLFLLEYVMASDVTEARDVALLTLFVARDLALFVLFASSRSLTLCCSHAFPPTPSLPLSRSIF